MSQINRKLVPLKMLLFFLYAAIGCLPAFLTIHMFHIGLSYEEVTWINTVLPLAALIGPPSIGYLADKFGHYRLITITTMFLAGVFHTSLLFVPERSPLHQPNLQMVCGNEGSSLVLQSCTGECPQIPAYQQGRFRITSCRQECDIETKYCGVLYFASDCSLRNNTDLKEVHVPAETSIAENPPPNICLHNDEDAKCDDFGFTSFIDVKMGFEPVPSSVAFFGRYADCCEYPLSNYTTESDSFVNMTCNPYPGCHIVCNVNEMETDSYLLQKPICSKEGSSRRITFWLYFCIRAVADLFPAILISMFDAVVLTMVTQHGGDYGRQKMFGLFAIGTSAPIVGYLMDMKIGVHGTYVYSPVFYVFDILLLVTAVITFLLPLKIEMQRKSMVKNLKELIHTCEFNMLIFIVIILGSLDGYLETFLYIYLLELGASKLLLGFTITVGIVPSLPFLYKSESIVKYCGHHYLLILAFVGYCVQFAGLSYLRNPLWVIPVEMLELFTINLMQVTAATLAYKLAPKTLVATAQGLVWISHFDIGRSLGTVIGGYLIKMYGMVRVFQGASVFAAICAIIYLTLYQVFKYVKVNRPHTLLAQDTKETGAISNGNYMCLPVIVDKKC